MLRKQEMLSREIWCDAPCALSRELWGMLWYQEDMGRGLGPEKLEERVCVAGNCPSHLLCCASVGDCSCWGMCMGRSDLEKVTSPEEQVLLLSPGKPSGNWQGHRDSQWQQGLGHQSNLFSGTRTSSSWRRMDEGEEIRTTLHS